MQFKTFAPLSNRRYLVYWLTGLMANFGWLIQLVGASWLMTSIGGSETLVALVQTAVALPMMLFTLPAGALADVFGRRTIVLLSQASLLVISLSLAVVAWSGHITPWMLLTFTFLIGSCRALNHPGWQSYINEFLSREELPAAINLNSVNFNIGRSVGPALGGIIVATLGAYATFVVNAAANLCVLVSAWSWPASRGRSSLPPEPMGAAILAGVRYVMLSGVQMRLIVRSFFFNLTGTALMALLPLIARDNLGGGASTYGLLLSLFGVGAVGGAFINGPFRSRFGRETQVRIAVGVFGAATLGIAYSPWMPLTLLLIALAAAFWMLNMSGLNTALQMSSPRWVVSRCVALYQSISFAGQGIGAWLWGALAGEVGTPHALAWAAAATVASMVIGLILPLRDFDTLGLDPDSTWTPPNANIDMLPKSGPIVVTVTYRILEADRADFLSAMAQRRRQRLRDGARRWTLSRDIVDAELWYERYKCATWTEVERHHTRRTVAGANLVNRIRALNRDGERPSVHYELVRHPELPRDSSRAATSTDF